MKPFIKHLCTAALLTVMAGASFGAEALAPVDAKAMVTTPSGLQYNDVKPGTGAIAKTGGNVSVHYTGWLQNPDGSMGKKFDSSRDRGQPFKFPLGGGQVIRGWDEGVQGMQVGGQRRLVIPAALGYGQRGAAGVIPPGATLIFDVELLGL
ncbi:MAG: FKBP-type peptidyl-prolyl cis-trans isomerase FkpA [Bradyrhizobium sp.]|jgi:FKBP-type peptidyl-prolyl cis-trans isomerase FkpA